VTEENAPGGRCQASLESGSGLACFVVRSRGRSDRVAMTCPFFFVADNSIVEGQALTSTTYRRGW
jgi:hypothetical protein